MNGCMWGLGKNKPALMYTWAMRYPDVVDEVYTSITSMMGFRGSASMAMVEFEGNNQPLCLIVSCNACNK